MKYFGILYLLAAFLLITSCSQEAQEEVADEKAPLEFIKLLSEEIETYDSDSSEIETVEYIYSNENDLFWSKAVYKDASGEITKTIEKELDKDGLPIKEVVKELDLVTESAVTVFSPETYVLLEKTDYRGEAVEENKATHTVYNYEDGYLMSQTVDKFSSDMKFKNSEGKRIESTYTLRFLPAKENRPQGKHIITYFVEKYKKYCTGCEDDCNDKKKETEKKKAEKKSCCDNEEKCKVGDIEVLQKTEFNEEGYPIHMVSSQPDCDDSASEEWYKVEKDGLGNVISLTGYSDKEMTKSTPKNHKINYEYDGKGMIISIKEYKYNAESSEYDRFHDLQAFTWAETGINNPMYAFCPSVTSEHYCFGRKHYSKSTKMVEKFADGEKVIIKSSFGEDSDGPIANVELEIDKKITKKFTIMSK